MRISHVILVASAMFFLGSNLFSQELPWPPNLEPVRTGIKAEGKVFISSRKDIRHEGTFKYKVDMSSEAGSAPRGTAELTIDLSDTNLPGIVTVNVTKDNLKKIYSTGKHTPTAFVYAECQILPSKIKGYLWMMLADNKPLNASGTLDVVQFVLLERSGKRIAHGCGPDSSGGDVSVASTTN